MSAAEIAFAEAPSRFSDVSCGQSAGDVFQLESRTLGSEDFPRTVGFNRLGVPQNHHFFAGGFSIHQPFWGSPMENPKHVGKVCRKRLSGNNVHCCEPFRHSCWHFFHNVYFVLKFSLKGTLSRRYQKTCLCLSTCQGEVVFDQGSDRHKTCTTRYGLITLPLWDWLRRRRCRQVLHHSERWSPLVAQELSVCCMNSQRSGRSSCCISGCQNMCMLYACKQKLH